MSLEELAHIHPGNNREWGDNDINGVTILVVRHVFNRNDFGNNPFVTMTAGEFVADADLAHLGDFDLDDLLRARFELVARFTGENLNINDRAALTVWQAQ